MFEEKNKMQVWIIGPSPPPYNGMSVCTENLLSHLDRSTFEVSHIDIADRRGLANIGKLDIINILLALLHGFQFVLSLTYKRPDIVYIGIAQNRLGFLRDCLFLIPTRLFRLKLVVHLHGGEFHHFYNSSPKWFRGLIRWTLRNAEQALVLSVSFVKCFSGIISPSKIVVIPNGVSDIEPKELVSEEIDATRIIVLYLSTLHRRKGYQDVLRVASQVLSESEATNFQFAGEIVDQNELDVVLHALNLDHETRIRFLGPQMGINKNRLLQNADILIFTPRAPEGQSLVILEAMSAGLPIVATNQGAITDCVIDGVNGFIMESGDIDGIKDKLMTLINDKSLREKMGEASRELYLKQFTLERWVKDVESVLAQVGGLDLESSS